MEPLPYSLCCLLASAIIAWVIRLFSEKYHVPAREHELLTPSLVLSPTIQFKWMMHSWPALLLFVTTRWEPEIVFPMPARIFTSKFFFFVCKPGLILDLWASHGLGAYINVRRVHAGHKAGRWDSPRNSKRCRAEGVNLGLSKGGSVGSVGFLLTT